MKRKEARLLKKLEKEPAKALMETQDHYYPQLQARLNQVKDPKDARYTTYSSTTILGMGLVKKHLRDPVHAADDGLPEQRRAYPERVGMGM